MRDTFKSVEEVEKFFKELFGAINMPEYALREDMKGVLDTVRKGRVLTDDFQEMYFWLAYEFYGEH